MTPCPRCGVDVAYVYDTGDELIMIDAARVSSGDVRIDGPAVGHRVAPGLGTHRAHHCVESDGRGNEWRRCVECNQAGVYGPEGTLCSRCWVRRGRRSAPRVRKEPNR